MMRKQWRRKLSHAAIDGSLASWLAEPNSLTARCQRQSKHFRVRLLFSGWMRPFGDEARARQRLQVREVLLECDGVPVIFAHSVLLTATNGRLRRWLAGLGSRSLGSLLFAHPGFKRSPLEFRYLDNRHPLYWRAAAWSDGRPGLWARRSTHRLGAQVLSVTEVFLPGIKHLSSGAPGKLL